jgi:signal transduction histidine kinase/CheY-like chemotaxis protein
MALNLLLVDDEEGIRRFLGMLLKDLGYAVRVASDGAGALEAIDSAQPDLVLTDIKMPRMDGIELLKRIKSRWPEIEVIMISGHGDLDLAIQCLQHQATDFVTKPVNEDILDAALRRVAEKIELRRKLSEYTQNLERLIKEKSDRVVELERQMAASQVVDALCQALQNLSDEMREEAGYNADMPCYIAVHNRLFEVVSTNRLYRERLGDKRGRCSWEAYADPARRGFDNPVCQTFKSGKARRSREMLLALTGEQLPAVVYTTPIGCKEDRVELVLEMAVDVSEISRLQEELWLTQQKYQDLFDETPCYIVVRDKDYLIKANNRLFTRDFGDGVGRNCYSAFRHRTEPCPECPVSRTFEDGEPHHKESVVSTRDGREMNILTWSTPIHNTEGEIVEVMELSTDITEIRKLQDHLTSLGLMLGSMSHGVKGMLTALEGGVYRLESGLAKNDMTRVGGATESIKVLVNRIRNLVLNVLYYAKSREPEREELDVAEFGRMVAGIVEPRAQREKIVFSAAIGEGLGRFAVDSGNLSAALVNIMENAIDACTADSGKDGHTVALRVDGDEREVRFEITDNGLGMDRETKEKAFTLFFSSKGLKGTGLGLFIASDVITKHGGAISLESERGQGTSFSIRLPRNLSAAGAEAGTAN